MRKANEIEISIAKTVLRAVELRESSYNHIAADIATKQADEERKQKPNSIFAGLVDYKQFYTMSLEDACYKAAEEGPGIALGRLIYLALDCWWNDTIDWAQQLLDPTATIICTPTHCQHGLSHDIDCDKCCEFWDKKRMLT